MTLLKYNDGEEKLLSNVRVTHVSVLWKLSVHKDSEEMFFSNVRDTFLF